MMAHRTTCDRRSALMNLKDTLQFYRKRQGLSQIELADALEVSRQTVSKWETGTALPSAENLLALSRLYSVSTDALLNGVQLEAPQEPAPPADTHLDPLPERIGLPRQTLFVWILAAVLLADLVLFFMDSSPFTGFLTFFAVLRILVLLTIGLCFAWQDRRWPAKKRTSLLIAAAALFLGLYPLLFSPPLLWKLYDLIAWSGLSSFETAFPTNPVRTFIAWTLCDELVILAHMCCAAAFQLGRLWFSRKRTGVLQPQTAR